MNTDEVIAARESAAIANYLFGNSNEKFSESEQNIAKQAANKILNENLEIQKIVVQSLRINFMLQFANARDKSDLGMDLLEAYGSNVPDKPNPNEHIKLLTTLISNRPEGEQQELYNFVFRYKLIS